MSSRPGVARVAAALLLGVVTVLAAASPAGAHAVLLSSNPADRARLDEAPAEVVLEFSEGVSAGLGAVRVFDGDGERVDEGTATAAGGVLTAPLRAGLGDGAYVIAWRAVSADSHPIHGALTFTVGAGDLADDATIAGLLGDGDDRAYEIAGAASRVLAYGGALLAAGLAAFLVLALGPGAAPEAPRLRRRLRLAAAAGAVGLVAAVPVRAALATGLGPSSITEGGVLGQVLGDGIGLATAGTLAGLAVLAVDAGRRRSVSLGGAVVATASFALAGHTTTSEPAWLSVGGDVVHVVAGAVWFGGLVGLVTVLRARRADGASSAEVVARFSGVAAVALAAVAVAGTALAWNEVRALRALTGTTYGRLLLVKVAIVAVVAALGGWNRFRLVPALARAPRTASARLRRTVGVEAGALAVATVLTAFLVNVTPARAAAGIGALFSADVALGDGSVNVVVDPNRVGTNSIHLYTFDAAGRPFDPEGGLTLELSLPAADIGPLEREPFVAGPGHWQLDGDDLSISGDWTIEVVARTSRFDEATALVEVTVNP